MKKQIILMATFFLMVSCNSGSSTSSDIDYCKYATKKTDYSFFFKGDVIEKCTVTEPQTKTSEEAGYKSISHTAKLELNIKNSKGEVRSNKRWIQIMGDGDKFNVIQNKTIQ